MTKKNIRLIGILLIVLLSVLIASLPWIIGQDEGQPSLLTSVSVRNSAMLQTSVVELGDMEESIRTIGVLQPAVRVDVGVQVTGQLQELKVKLGQKVQKDDLLAIIDPSIATNELREKEASLDQQKSDLTLRYMDLESAHKELKRQRYLLSQEAVARIEVDESELKVKRAEAALTSLNAQIQQSQAVIESARTKLLYTQIKAPYAGDIINIAVQPGQTLVASQQAPTLLTLAKMDEMTVTAQIPEVNIPQIKVGQPVYFTTLGEPENRIYSKVEAIRPTAKNVKDAMFYEAFFTVPNSQRKLFIDMTVQVAFVLKEYKKVLLIPLTALGPKGTDDRWPVLVVNNGKTIEKRIEVGADNHISAIVLDGLKAGETVMTAYPHIKMPAP